jgi:protoheme IX farnesyltransferase
MVKNKDTCIVSPFAELIRFRLSLAVTVSSVTGYFIFHNTIELNLWFMIAGVFLLASGASVLNQYSEIRYDALMRRTMQRPLPAKKVSPESALLFSIFLLCSGILFLSLTGFYPVLLGILNVILYNVIYTKLKRVTPLAVIPGALVGAVPPLIGFSAAGGIEPGFRIILFSSFMFFWQLPHFWLILLKYNEEYEAAGFVTISHLLARKQILNLIFLWILFSTALLILAALSGIVFSSLVSIMLIPFNIIFILIFYYLLYRKSENEVLPGAFIMVNAFCLFIMILFIINSVLF